jgi:arabinogalactan endo-1,4-beta-galactosidase
LPQLESRGMTFYDKGVETDAIVILKDHGFNYIRLRVFVNPENEKGYSPNTGFCGLENTLKMARRVKDAGLNLLLDFHYSDTWADPQKQYKPKAWEGLAFEELTTRLKTYTKSVLLELKEQGTMPDMVQVGNEINHGIVWPEGHISNLDNLAALLKAGTEAVREVDASTTVMMHLALGGQNEETVFWFDNMIARGVEFDIIGLSYYPQWHCTLDDLNANMLDIINRYQKDINVVEYSAFKREVHDLVFNLPENRGNGTCIWEPLNTWSRIFDRQGNALDDITIYDEMKTQYLTD